MDISDNLFYIFREEGKPLTVVKGFYFVENKNTISISSTGKYYVSRYDQESKQTIVVGEILDTITEQYEVKKGQSTLSKVSDETGFVAKSEV